MTNNDGDEKRLKNDFLAKLKKSFEEIDRLAAEFIAQNEKLRASNNYLDPNGGQQFKQAKGKLEQGKAEEGRESGDSLDPNGGHQFKQARGTLGKR